jgi:hypothetical protein
VVVCAFRRPVEERRPQRVLCGFERVSGLGHRAGKLYHIGHGRTSLD